MFSDSFNAAVFLSCLLGGGLVLSVFFLTFKFSGRRTLMSLSILGHLPFLFFSLLHSSSLEAPLRLNFAPLSFHFGLSFFFDGLSSLFFGLISFTGIFVSIFASRYFKSLDDLRSALGLLYLFAVSMYGLVCSDNLLLLFVFWELTTLVSFFLIAFKKEDPEARKSAIQALLLTGLGGLALLVSILALAQTLPAPSVSHIFSQPRIVSDSPHDLIILTGFLIAIMTKSAIFPFHYWLPGAMKAPTPVSAYLHSATMVKAGIFLYARLAPAFQFAPMMNQLLVLFGGITSVWGMWQCFRGTDLKLVLAHTTVSALGLIMMLIGSGNPDMMIAGLLVLTAHAIYKSGLFINLGSLEKLFGHRDLTQMNDLFSRTSFLASGFLLLILSLMGIPPFLGFVAKESAYLASSSSGPSGQFITVCLFIVSTLSFGLGLKLLKILSPQPGYPKNIKNQMHVLSWLGPFLLGSCSLGFGLYPQGIQQLYFESAVQGLLQKSYSLDLSLWHGFNKALALSFISMLLGFVVYNQSQRLGYFCEAVGQRLPSLSQFHERFLSLLVRVGHFQKNLLTPRNLQEACIVVFISISSSLALLFFVYSEHFFKLFGWSSLSLSSWEAAPLILGLSSCVLVFFAKSMIPGLLAGGLAGFSVVLIFAFFSAPDLALTQILVETFILILLASLLFRISINKVSFSSLGKILSYLIPATAAGLITWAHSSIQSPPLSDRVSSHFARDSYEKAHGKNVVNVILVDFRGLDTLGELTVLGIAALGACALVGRRSRISKKDPL